jgi:hypothetical protein
MSRRPLEGIRNFGDTFALLFARFLLVSCLPYCSTLKMEAIYPFETSIDLYRTTQCYIPEDSTLHIFTLISNQQNPVYAD